MANDENLIPFRTETEARAKGRIGGIKSGEARRRKRDARKIMLDILGSHPKLDKRTLENLHQLGIFGSGKGKDQYDIEMIINAAIAQKAMRGDVKAYQALLGTIGEDPRTKLYRETAGLQNMDEDGPLVIQYDYGDEAEDEDDDQ